MSKPSPLARRLVLAGLSLAAASCAQSTMGGSPNAGATAGAEATYATIEEAQQALAKAESDIQGVSRARPPTGEVKKEEKPKEAAPLPAPTTPPRGPSTTPQPQGQAAQEEKRDAPAKQADKRSVDAEKQSGDEGQHDDGCRVGCRAFASMKRASEAICRMAGEHDERCVVAKRKVSENEERVARCGCPR